MSKMKKLYKKITIAGVYFFSIATTIFAFCFTGLYLCRSAKNITFEEAFVPYTIVTIMCFFMSFCVAAVIATLDKFFMQQPVLVRRICVVTTAAIVGIIPLVLWRLNSFPVLEIFDSTIEYLTFGGAGVLALLLPKLVWLFLARFSGPRSVNSINRG